MRTEINNEELEQVTGGSVRLNTTKMMIGFSVTQKKFKLKNCSDTQAMILVATLYEQYKTAGDRAYEEATYKAFHDKGWLDE